MQKKVFIFDFDGTLYSGEHIFDKIPKFIANYKRNFLPNITDAQYNQIVNENPSWLNAYSGAELAKHIYLFMKKYPNLNITIKDFRKWELNVIEPVDIDKKQTINPAFLKKLCQDYPVYIVSNSDIIHVKHIISNQFLAKDQTKKHYYKDILAKENCSPQNAYVFGDSERSDISPALKLGINAFLIKDSRKIQNIIENIIK